jgi:hypothetical protein
VELKPRNGKLRVLVIVLFIAVALLLFANFVLPALAR